MATNIKTLLKQLGLSDNEAKTYIALSRMGEARVQDVAHHTGLARTTTASILERLKDLGFLTVQKSRGKFLYWIEDPHILVEQEKARLDVAEQLAGRLHGMYHSSDKKPHAEIYDTKDGIRMLMTKVVQEIPRGGEVLVFESPMKKHYQSVITDEFFHAMSKRKVKKGITTKALVPVGQKEYIRKAALEHNVDVRFLPVGVAMETSFWILDKSIVMFYGAHTFAVRVQHRHTRESMKSLFDYLWEKSDRLVIE